MILGGLTVEKKILGLKIIYIYIYEHFKTKTVTTLQTANSRYTRVSYIWLVSDIARKRGRWPHSAPQTKEHKLGFRAFAKG